MTAVSESAAWLPELPHGRMVELPGRGETFVRDTGEQRGRPTLLLLHGLAATGDTNWFACFKALAARGRVVSLDHRGHGRGIRSSGRFRLVDCADDAVALCDVLGLDRVVPVGYSMGGPIAQLMWYRHRDRHLVDGLVLCATSRNFVKGRRLARVFLPAVFTMLSWVPESRRRALRQRVVGDPLAGDDRQDWFEVQAEAHDRNAVLHAARALTSFSSRTWIGDVDVPTAVVVTTRDQLVPPERQRSLARAIPGATVHEAPADHLDVAFAPARFVPALLDAVDSVIARL